MWTVLGERETITRGKRARERERERDLRRCDRSFKSFLNHYQADKSRNYTRFAAFHHDPFEGIRFDLATRARSAVGLKSRSSGRTLLHYSGSSAEPGATMSRPFASPSWLPTCRGVRSCIPWTFRSDLSARLRNGTGSRVSHNRVWIVGNSTSAFTIDVTQARGMPAFTRRHVSLRRTAEKRDEAGARSISARGSRFRESAEIARASVSR